jgi:feruloyl esterase
MNRALILFIGAAAAALALAARAHDKPDPEFTLASPGSVLTGYVTGASVPITVTSTERIRPGSLKLKLNGVDVTSALHADPSGSLSGTVAGLEPGANAFELFARDDDRHSNGHDRHRGRHDRDWDQVAQLTIMKAVAPALVCDLNTISNLTGFPIQPSGTMGGTRITAVALTAATATLPEYCLVRGIMEERSDGLAGIAGTSSFRTNQHYGTLFEVRLPTAWNGRYMFQGSGGTEGNLPGATGNIGGSGGAQLANGFVVASQNGGHANGELPGSFPPGPITDLNHIQVLSQNMFFPDAKAVKDWAYNSIDTTTQTAKFLIDAYYGRAPEKSYFVGCSTSGRQGMAMSQRFPQHYDGIVAGDPFYLPPEISLSETWGLEHIIAISPIVNGVPQYVQSFPLADQNLFTNAILAACDHLDGLVDNVIDNAAACRFDPATFVFPSSGVYGTIAPGMPLQCATDDPLLKTATCLLPKQVNATKKIDQGPRNSRGRRIVTPDGTTLVGYPFDGGFMQPSGIPTRDIGTATQPPGNIGLGSGQLPLFWFATPDPAYNPLTVNYDTDIGLVTPASPAVNNSTRIEPFLRRGGKLIFYHGLSDSGPPWPYTLKYFRDVARRQGGLESADRFMKLYLIPNMGHCSGNIATDSFDMLTPMVNWIENGVAPEEIIATGNRFPATVGPYVGLGNSTRSRPLCPYPKTLRYSGTGDISQASSYVCIAPEGGHDHDHDHGHDHDHDRDDR